MAKAAHASNEYDPEVVRSLLSKIDHFENDLASERGSYMATCRNIREDIKNVYDEAKALGVPQKELKTLCKIRKKEAEAKKLYLDLEADQQQNLALLAATEKVADLPLWRAAKARGTSPDENGKMPHAEPMFEDNAKHADFKPLR